MRRFRYLRDPLFLLCCALYALNRWGIRPHTQVEFFHSWFNDTLLLPCALPPVLLLHQFAGLRRGNRFPGGFEIFAHWLGWSILFEYLCPRFMPHTTGDPWDVVAYAVGAIVAYFWWRHAGRAADSVASEPGTFDLLAPHYRWMEHLLAGGILQQCRTAFLPRIASPCDVLVLGQGTGRFVAALIAAHPQAHITCVDSSAGMIQQARSRLGGNPNVSFVHADVFAWSAPERRFDLVVSHFFLDCFQPTQIARLAEIVARAATPEAQWLVSDFREPASGPARWRALAILRLLYVFFRRVTGLSGNGIVPPESVLPSHGFRLRDRRLFDWGLLHSDWWVRGPAQEFSPRGRLFHSSPS